MIDKKAILTGKLNLLVAGMFIFFGTISVQGQQQASSSSKKFETLLRIVDRAYVDSTEEDELVEHAIRSMLKEMDPHSMYISKEDLKKMNEPLVGNFEGIGIEFNILHDTIIVVSPISGGPSEALGIQSGDKIVAINGENVAGIGIKNKDVTDKLRGKKGTEVTVGIKRNGSMDLLDYTIKRDKIPIYSVDASYMAAPEIGFLRLNRFAANSIKEFHDAMEKLQQEGMKHLILDLRGNSGGYLKTAIELADEFLPSQKLIVYTEGRAFPKDEKLATSRGMFETGKLVVLIDEGSASASEIVSGAIQDWDRGLVLGRRSFGKGLVQKPYALPDGSAVRLTVSRYYTPTGRSIQKPYDQGAESYYKELIDRYEHGEFFSRDSIRFPDSLKFYTPKDRVVYGGGGIMPDIFVPRDTTMISDYYQKLRRKGLLNEFCYEYLDKNRKSLSKKYPTVAIFNATFNAEKEILEAFVDFAASKGIEKDEKDWEKSEDLITVQLKALIARGFWKTSGYYEVFQKMDNTILKAIEVIQDDTFERLHLADRW